MAPKAQKKLRDELLQVSSDSPSMDELNALPYLDAVVRETLRLYAPLPFTFRVSVKDDVLPLSTPVRDKVGKVHESLQSVEIHFLFAFKQPLTGCVIAVSKKAR